MKEPSAAYPREFQCPECGALLGHWRPCSMASPELQERWRKRSGGEVVTAANAPEPTRIPMGGVDKCLLCGWQGDPTDAHDCRKPSAARSLHPQELPDVNLGRSDDHARDFDGSCACGRDHSNKFEGGAEDRPVARANKKPVPALDAESVSEWTRWKVFWRRDAKSPWFEYASEASEHNGAGVRDDLRREYPHYEVELRKVTIREERVDV